jgi:hypothetical protein
MVYRRRADALDSEWHFHSDCPNWPELGSIQIQFLKPNWGDRICAECIKLESNNFSQQRAVYPCPAFTSTSSKARVRVADQQTQGTETPLSAKKRR